MILKAVSQSCDLYQLLLNVINDIQKTLIWHSLGIFSEGMILDVKGPYVIYALKETEANSGRTIGFDVTQIWIWILA